MHLVSMTNKWALGASRAWEVGRNLGRRIGWNYGPDRASVAEGCPENRISWGIGNKKPPHSGAATELYFVATVLYQAKVSDISAANHFCIFSKLPDVAELASNTPGTGTIFLFTAS